MTAESFSKPRRDPVSMTRGWITQVDGADPARISVQTEGGWVTCTLEIVEPFASSPWVVESILGHLRVAQFVVPEVLVVVKGFDGLAVNADESHREAYRRVDLWSFREVEHLRAAHRDGAVEADGRFKFQWLDLTLQRLIEEENRRGYLAPDILRSQAVQLLEALRSPLDRLHRLFDLRYLH